MKAWVQRVSQASVTVQEQVVGRIDQGLCVLLGIHRNDTVADIDYIIKILLNTKLWPDEANSAPWKRSVTELPQSGILVVSQFTLYAICGKKGRAPDFHLSMKADAARDMFLLFIEKLKAVFPRPENIQTGKFQNYMSVQIVNDGPVSVEIESPHYQKALNANSDATNIVK